MKAIRFFSLIMRLKPLRSIIMEATPREIICQTLRFENPQRIGRHTWALPGASKMIKEYRWFERYPDDITRPPSVYKPSPRLKGDAHAVGTFIDEWGVVWENLQAGHIGEVKNPMLENWDDMSKKVQPPYETLPGDIMTAIDTVNSFCDKDEHFVMASCCPRPWERYQFIRGTFNSLIDMADPDENVTSLLKIIHDFYCKELEFFVKTNVDGIGCMDDWGSQWQLLINPKVWREIFKPMYKDYCDIIHSSGKFVFMHSDGFISEIYPDLIEVGVDALNSQLFCMDMAKLAEIAKGKITFWGEIDRQHVLIAQDPAVGRAAVQKVAEHLYDPAGGIIAQFEMAGDVNIDVAAAIMDEWQSIHAKRRT